MSEQRPTIDPDRDPVDVSDNPESRAGAEKSASRVARASDGGPPPRDAPAAGEEPEAVEGGSAAGNPVAGVTLDEDEVEKAVEPDDNAMEVDGPQAGHA